MHIQWKYLTREHTKPLTDFNIKKRLDQIVFIAVTNKFQQKPFFAFISIDTNLSVYQKSTFLPSILYWTIHCLIEEIS